MPKIAALVRLPAAVVATCVPCPSASRGERISPSSIGLVKAGQPPKPAAAYTNQTYVVDNWTLFQSGAAQDHWSYTILGVGNRHGIVAMVIACTLITIGCMYAFYVKPILIRRLQLRSTQKAEARQKPAAPVAAQEVVEVG